MTDPTRRLHFCCFPHGGPLAWRQPGVTTEGYLDFEWQKRVAQTAERGLFDAIFIADNVAINHWLTGMDAADKIGNAVCFEPLTLLSALSTVTSHIGLMATMSTTYYHPFLVARMLASLDHLSGGRAGWNVVTSKSPSEAANFGLQGEIASSDRYVRANEFVDVVKGLWDSFTDDAFVRDKAGGAFYAADKMRALDHAGAEFRVAGPLNIPRPPQGHPVLCQAGQSEDGMDLAARTSDLIFNNKHTAQGNRAFREDVRRRAARVGRNPDDLLFMPGVFVVIGGTEEEAQAKIAAARDAVDETTAKRFLKPFLRSIDLDQIDYDAPPPHTDAVRADAAAAGMVLEGNGRALTIRELCSSHGNHWRQFQLVGTPEQVADGMTQWFELGVVDGFNLMTLQMPDGYADIADAVVPLLQRRGIYREGYEGKTLRENLGLSRPGLT
jgi:FMN-dependent oxidoreductase (nitrilotriacetate monooxygenase family)